MANCVAQCRLVLLKHSSRGVGGNGGARAIVVTSLLQSRLPCRHLRVGEQRTGRARFAVTTLADSMDPARPWEISALTENSFQRTDNPCLQQPPSALKRSGQVSLEVSAIALEPLYTPQQVADYLHLDTSSVRRILADRPGIVVIGRATARGGKKKLFDSPHPTECFCEISSQSGPRERRSGWLVALRSQKQVRNNERRAFRPVRAVVAEALSCTEIGPSLYQM